MKNEIHTQNYVAKSAYFKDSKSIHTYDIFSRQESEHMGKAVASISINGCKEWYHGDVRNEEGVTTCELGQVYQRFIRLWEV